MLLDILAPLRNNTIDQIPHAKPSISISIPIPPRRCNGLVEYLFQNYTDIMSTNPLMVRFQLYLVYQDVLGL